MIIFNLYAIPVAIICFIAGVISVGILSVVPGLSENETLQGVIMYGVMTVTAGLCEAIGLRGRLFFIPMYLIGFVLTFATVVNQYGWAGVGVMVVMGIGLMGVIFCLAHVMEGKEWEAAPTERAQCQAIQDPSRKDFWEHFQKAVFFPTVKSYTNYIHYHNYQALELLKKLEVEWPVIDPLMNACAANTHEHSDIDVEEKQTDELKKLIEEQLEAFA